MIPDFLQRQPKENILRIGVAIALITGLIDYLTGPQLTLSVFYLVPVIVVTMFHSTSFGVIVAFGCAVVLLLADLASGFEFSSPAIPFWNAGVRLCSFLVVVYVLSLRQQTDTELQEANTKLSGWVQELEKRNRDIMLLGQTADLLQACATREEAYNLVSKAVAKMFNESPGALLCINESKNILQTVASWNEWQGEAVCAPSDCWAIRRAKFHYSNSNSGYTDCGHSKKGVAGLCVPMNAQGHAIGVLHLENVPESDDLVKLATAVAEQAALALSNLSMRETLSSLAIRDPLTGLYNRRYLQEAVQMEIARASRSGATFCICMIDLDHFKKFNDTFGHDAGDALLKRAAEILKTGIRAGDISSRYGGEEFVLLLGDTTLPHAVSQVQRMKQALREVNVQHNGASLGPVTFSAGISQFPIHGYTADSLIRAADSALYRAKSEGRDRVLPAINLDSTTPLV